MIPPQAGNNNTVTFPENICDSDYLKTLEPLGWIHTQASETLQLSPQDIITHSKIMINNKNLNVENSIIITVAFPPGSCAITAYKVTPAGKKNKKSKF